MKLTKYEVSAILDAWCDLNMLGAVLDEKFPDRNFPKGRLKTALQISLRAYKKINKIVCRPDFEEHCAKKRKRS